jgi:hypothetical protein
MRAGVVSRQDVTIEDGKISEFRSATRNLVQTREGLRQLTWMDWALSQLPLYRWLRWSPE